MKRTLCESGFTIVELLVVVFIIGLLVALLLPAIQAARESARRVQCMNHAKQLVLAAITHEERHGHYPTGGWGQNWVGDADRGFGEEQPGGWAFNVLPFIEETALRDLARDGSPGVVTDKQRKGAGELAGTAIPIMYCPSRRAPLPYPWHPDDTYTENTIVNAIVPALIGKLDYATNGGDQRTLQEHKDGPRSFDAARVYRWANDRIGHPIFYQGVPSEGGIPRSILTGASGFSGISFRRSEVGARHVTDGTSNTYLLGEKYVPDQVTESGDVLTGEVDTGLNYGGDRMPWTIGYSYAVTRFSQGPPSRDQDRDHKSIMFGSAHPSGLHMGYCDGSVHYVDYGIDTVVHRAAGHRADGIIDGVLTYGLLPQGRP